MADPSKFIKDLLPYAVEVGDRYGIDPVTIITQAALETGWGEEVAGNNYFGIKSHGQPGGQSVTTHEEINGKKVKVQDHFRTYGSLEDSVNDYGRFLTENPRYAEAIAQQGYQGELGGIAGAGYATDSKYPQLVQNVASSVMRRMQPLPPGSIPTVGTQLDVRRPAPTPASAATRDMALNSPQNTNLGLASFSRSAAVTPPSLQASLENYVRPQQNAVTPAIRRPQLPAMGTPDVNSLYSGIYPQAAPRAVPQSAIERGPARLPTRSSAEINSTVRSLQQSPALAAALAQRGPKLTDPGAINRSVGSLSNTPLAASLNRVAAGNARAPQSTIERGVSRVAPVPSSQIERGSPRVVSAPVSPPRVTVSTPFTTPQSIIERSAPRTVAPSPVGQPPATRTVQSVPMPAVRPSIPQSGGVERGVPRIATPAPGAVTASYLGPFQQMSQPNRLPVGALPFVAPVQNVAPMAPPITPTPSIANVTMPIPRPNIPQPVAVPRPVVQPVYRPPAQIAPTTHPQIQVMARAPAPVLQQAGGFFFAPNGSGGFTNVGRVNSSISPAQQYAMLNAGNGGPRTSADRAGKSLSQDSGQRSFME